MYRFIQTAYPPQLVDYTIYVIDQGMAEIFVGVSARMPFTHVSKTIKGRQPCVLLHEADNYLRHATPSDTTRWRQSPRKISWTASPLIHLTAHPPIILLLILLLFAHTSLLLNIFFRTFPLFPIYSHYSLHHSHYFYVYLYSTILLRLPISLLPRLPLFYSTLL